ncbi:MAG: rhodanese-like domain-containing protein [Bacteroidota bacterium]
MKEITVQELKQMTDSKAEFVLIDVREQYEYDEANLGGILIPLGSVLDRISEIPKDTPVVIHCRSGMRSATAIRELENRFGYTNLSNLKGGIMAWQSEIGIG